MLPLIVLPLKTPARGCLWKFRGFAREFWGLPEASWAMGANVRRPLKTTFDTTTLTFSTGGCPSYPFNFYSFKRGPWYPVFCENPSREVATKDHSSSNPPKGNPPDLKTKVDVSKVNVKGFPRMEEVPRCTSRAPFASPCFFAYFNRSGSKGAFRLPGATWDHFRCTVEPSPGHIGC